MLEKSRDKPYRILLVSWQLRKFENSSRLDSLDDGFRSGQPSSGSDLGEYVDQLWIAVTITRAQFAAMEVSTQASLKARVGRTDR
jgi:hypothetical protein